MPIKVLDPTEPELQASITGRFIGIEHIHRETQSAAIEGVLIDSISKQIRMTASVFDVLVHTLGC